MTVATDAATGLLVADAWTGRILSGGEWRNGAGGTQQVTDKATGEALAEVGIADAADVARAAATAKEAQPAWAATPPSERREVFVRAADVLRRHHAEVEAWLIRETGGIRHKAEFELLKARENLLAAAATATRSIGEVLPSRPGVTSLARRVPRGVIGVITPWNFPLVLALRSLAPALAVGNAVVLKPDPHTPVTGGVALARLFEEAGLPAGVLQVVFGDAPTGEALVVEPNVDMISFTGSTAVGLEVQAAAAPLLKKCVLELGGNNALVVLDDADLDLASSAGAWSSFLFQGQVCMTAGRHIVQRAVADEYVERLVGRAERLRVGDPSREEVALGPMINARQVARVQGIVDASVAAGAKLLTGGTFDGPFYRPTVLHEVAPTTRAFSEEIFGPVAPVTVVDSDDEAVELANQSEYGLTAAVQSASESRAIALAERLRAGVVHVNDQTVVYETWAPFGGLGVSGNGDAFGGPADVEFTEWQWVTRRAQSPAYPF